MRKLTKDELNKIIENHDHWLRENCDGWENMKADLSWTDLSEVDLSMVNLSWADLSHTNLSCANLSGAYLSLTNLSKANLPGVNLSKADLSGANLFNANLFGANLLETDLSDANLLGANLSGAENLPYIPIACPSTGSFVAWKKVNGYIIKLQIPEDAKRSSATTNKCRCDKALVLAIENKDGTDSSMTTLINTAYTTCAYTVGKMVYSDSWDNNRWNECTHGIHFFMNRQDAVNW